MKKIFIMNASFDLKLLPADSRIVARICLNNENIKKAAPNPRKNMHKN